jgi:hypothetical protein
MRKIVRNAAAGAVLGGSLLATAGLGVASAAPPSGNAVDLAIGNIKILQNASLDQAVSVAGAMCNINASQATSLAQQAATQNNAQTICSLPGGAVTFSQAGSINGGAGPATAGAPNNGANPGSPMNPMYPSEQQPG